MNRRHHELTGDQRMKNGEEKKRWGDVMDIEKGRKYVHQYHQKKVEEKNTVVKQAPKSNVERSDTTSAVAKELSSNRFLVQLWHGDNSDSINTHVNYRRFVDKIVEEEEENISDECSENGKGEHAPETEITHSNSENSISNPNIEKRLYQTSTKMATTSGNVINGSRAHHHSKTHHHSHSHNTRRPPHDDDVGQGPTSMIIMSQHHVTSNHGDEDVSKPSQHDEQQLYSLQSHYGHNNNKHDGHNHHRHGGHKHRSNSHAHGERKHIGKRNHSSDNNVSDPEKNLVGVFNNGNNSTTDGNYKTTGVFSSKSIKQGSRLNTSNNVNNSVYPQQQQPAQPTYKSSKPTTMAELNAKRSKCN